MKKYLVLFPNSHDGLASAVLFLRANAEQRFDIRITNIPDIVETLQSANTDEIEEIHILGVGVRDRLDDVIDTLQTIKLSKKNIVWYCGRGYLDNEKEQLSDYCTTQFVSSNSNTESIAQVFSIEKDDHLEHILNIAYENNALFNKKHKTKLDSNWLDLITALTEIYYKFYDNRDYLKVVKSLALSKDWHPFYDEIVKAYKRRVASCKLLTKGSTKISQEIKKKIKIYSGTKEPVLITGPSGTGKEYAALDIHRLSERKDKPFYAVNCADFAGNPDFAKCFLFGHKQGAFTGAVFSNKGTFEHCNEGTLFLDEIAELPLPVQTMLLRVLETGEFQSLGELATKKTDCRIIAATNQDLRQMVREGKFREDLFYRINVLPLLLPALLERVNDCKLIIEAINHEGGKKYEATTDDLKAISDYNWPGNFRELINLVRRAVHTGISLADCIKEEKALNQKYNPDSNQPTNNQPSIPLPNNQNEILTEEEIKKIYIKHVYKICNNNCKLTAKKLGLSENTIKKYLELK